MIIVEIFLCTLAMTLLVPVSVLFVQVLAAMPTYKPRPMPAGRRPTIAVLVPAHNEELMIADTLRAIVPQLFEGDRLLVVADNCSDGTAKIAIASGAEAIERFDSERRGKGYALDFGVRHLEKAPPEVVLIIDADCAIESDSVERLARLCIETGRPVQALYLMHAPTGAGVRVRIAAFAWLVKTHVRALGYLRLGLPCQLMGTGMAFPWATVSKAELASGHIVEDLKLGIDLVRMGTSTVFCPEARVTSFFPTSAEGITSQRTRWEHGHLGVILSIAPRLFFEATRRCDHNLLALVLDLCVPPLALLLLLVLMAIAGGGLFFVATKLMLPLWLLTAVLVMLALSVLLSWGRYGRHVISFASLAYAPVYAMGKIPLYLTFLVSRQIKWVRSKRDE